MRVCRLASFSSMLVVTEGEKPVTESMKGINTDNFLKESNPLINLHMHGRLC